MADDNKERPSFLGSTEQQISDFMAGNAGLVVAAIVALVVLAMIVDAIIGLF